MGSLRSLRGNAVGVSFGNYCDAKGLRTHSGGDPVGWVKNGNIEPGG